MKNKNWFRVYLEDVRIPLIISFILNTIIIFYNKVLSMQTGNEVLWVLIIGLLLISTLLIPFLYKLKKNEWKDAGLIASSYILLVCYFTWFVIIG